jgi:outer membrane protein with beta-barrel domain
MLTKRLTLAACLLATLSAREAAAQSIQAWMDRGYVNVNVGFESASGQLNDARTFRIYDEDGSLSTAQAVDSGALFDIAFGARVWENASVGLALHRGSTSSEAAVSGSVPHPLVFNRNRPIATTVADLGRTEQALHVQFGYMLPINEKVDVQVLLGPSFFKLMQDVVSDITVTEVGSPFTSVNAAPVVTERSDTALGFNIGADVTYHVYKTGNTRVGVGMFLRYAGASSGVELLSTTVDSDVGGLQVGFGGRLRF